jgi:TonB family protein
MIALITMLVALATFAADADSLATARDLYASAAYEDALAVLNRLPQANQPREETRAVEQYRALCLLALGRTAEAEHAIETVVAGDPGYRPAADVSPRVRTIFSDVRRRMLPSIIQKKYAWAKDAFDRKEFAAAASEFSQVLLAMTDPDVEAAAGKPPLSDLRTLAAGFRDLAETAAAPAPPPPLPAAEPAAAAPPVSAAPRVYTSADANVLPPTVLSQDLPPFPGQLVVERMGMIEVIIDETGAVETATMTQPVTQRYDRLALAAAKSWRYRPAMLNGVPVKYRKAVQVSVKPQR